MNETGEILVTGLGTVQTCGAGRDPLLRALATGRITSNEIGRFEPLHRAGGARRVLSTEGVDLSPWLSPREARRMSRPSKLAVAAASMALEDAGLELDRSGEGGGSSPTAVLLATSFGTVGFAEELIRTILREGPEAASPFHFSESVANAPAGQVAIAIGARAANVAVTQRESGPVQAVLAGARELRLGRASVSLVGTVDEITPLVHAVLDLFHALTRPDDGGEERPRPFGPGRDGYLTAEGSTVLVLESGEEARRRGAEPVARLVAMVRAFDPSSPLFDWGTGDEALADRLREGLRRHAVDPGSIRQVVSTASGSKRGDALEARILNRLFGDAMPPIAAPKGILGEYGGGHLATAALAPAGLDLASPPGFREPDEALGVVPADGPLPGGRTLVSALAAGGAASWLVLDPP